MNRDYQLYLLSPTWGHRRSLYFRSYDPVCAVCKTRRQLRLHHKTYVRVGHELDQDLVPLCDEHHIAIHRYAELNPELSLAEATEKEIRRLRHKERVRLQKAAQRRKVHMKLPVKLPTQSERKRKQSLGLSEEYRRRRDLREAERM